MSKPDDIPQDVWDEATCRIRDELSGSSAAHKTAFGMANIVARAILAERARIEALLKDPAAVRVNYLRGRIACQNLIDEAILAERERCAKVADQYSNFVVDSDFGAGYKQAALNIDAAIRKGGD